MPFRVTWVTLVWIISKIISVYGNTAYLDTELFEAIEKGETSKAAALLRKCDNDVSCSIIPDKDYDHYELWDFVRQPTISLVRPKVSVILGINSMPPSTIIHMKSPAAQRYLTSPGYYSNTEKVGMVEFKYQMSPETWLSVCVLRTNGQTECTDSIKAPSKSVSGGEILESKKSEENFQVQFRFGCKTQQCILILRQIRLHSIIKSPQFSRQTSAVLSDKAIEIINSVNEMSHYTYIDRGFRGRDLSHLIENAIQQEKDEQEMLNNPQTPAPSPLPKRPKASRTTTPTPTTTVNATRRSTTCRPRTTTTPAPSTPTTLQQDDDDDNSNNDDVPEEDNSVDVASNKTPGYSWWLYTAMAVQMVAFLGKFLGVALAGSVANALFSGSEESKNEEENIDNEFGTIKRVFPIVEGILQHLPFSAEEKTFSILRPLMLVGTYVVVKAAVELNRKEDSLLYEFVLNTKIHEDSVEKSISIHKPKFSPPENEGREVRPNGPGMNLDKDILLFETAIPQNLNYDKVDTGPSWRLFFEDNYPKLQIDKFDNWFIIDKSKSSSRKLSLSQTWSLHDIDNWNNVYGTVLTRKRLTSSIRTDFFQCPEGSYVRLPTLFQFYSLSSKLSIEICLQFLQSSIKMCSLRRSTECLNTWCGLDFTSYFNTQPEKYTPFQIVVKVKSKEDLTDKTLEPALLHIRSSILTNITDADCSKVRRSPVSLVRTKDLPECQDSVVPMIETNSVNLSTEYQDATQAYSAMTEFTFSGQWYKSNCVLDFNNKLSGWDTSFMSIVPRTIAISAAVTADDHQYLASEELKCTTKSLRLDFMLSTTSPKLFLYICLYRASHSVTYICSYAYQSSSYEYPNFQFYSQFSADKIEISVGSRNGFTNGTLTILFESMKVTCA